MDPAEIRRIRGSLSRAAFARMLGVTALTVLRWELPKGNKEARRPRAKMVEALKGLAAAGVDEKQGAPMDPSEEPSRETPTQLETSPDEPSQADERRVLPLLDQLCSEDWRRAEESLTALLSSDSLATRGARALATLGLVQVQVLGHMDLRGALAVLIPILDEASRGELADPIVARAHVMATLVFAAPDSRVHDLGRVNAHAARAEPLLPPDANDLTVMSAMSCIAAARYLGPEVTLHAYQAHLECLERARSPLARMTADALAGLVATVRGDAEASAELGGRALRAAEGMGHWGLVMGILSDYAERTLRGSDAPTAVLDIAQHGRQRAADANLVPTEGYIRLLAAECEALCRLARFDVAQQTAEEALAHAKRAGVARYSLTAPLSRLWLLTDRLAELREFARYYAEESSGPQHHAARLHANYLLGLLASVEGDFDKARELFEAVCVAPDPTPGREYIVHAAHFEAIVSTAMLRRRDEALAALRRFEQLLQFKPSIWHAAMARHAEALTLVQSGKLVDARRRVESTTATLGLLGDTLQALLEDYSLRMIDVALGAPDSAERAALAQKALEDLGVSSGFLDHLARPWVAAVEQTWREQTMAEKLLVASDRLSVEGLEQVAFLRELEAVLGFLFPGREALVGGADLRELSTTVELTADGAEPLRFGVRGSLDPEQHAFLQLLGAIVRRRPGPVPTPEPEVALDDVLPEFIAAAPATRRLKSEVLRLSRSNATLLIRGESGSGKEVVARAVHDASLRAKGPCVTLNCASVPRELFEGQLFGYKKGAFTGATGDSPGVIRAANGGTLFLDEIGELPLEMQPKLLRFLENGEVLPLGLSKPISVDVRIVAATHRDLDKLVRDGHFREDLYYRLNVVPICVPPLRERKEDVPVLAKLFISRLTEAGSQPPALGPSAIATLTAHRWPGNVRELRNVLERAMAYSPVPGELLAEHLRVGG